MTASSRVAERRNEAAEWMASRRSGAMTAHDERAFQVWLDRDPDNAAAFAQIERCWDTVGAAGDDAEIMALTELRARQFNRPARNLRFAAAAAGLATLAGVGWALTGAGLPGLSRPQVQEFRTSVGQRTSVTLPDGSVVTLDTDSILRTRETARERRVELTRGRAFFKVAKDAARPFVVAADGKTVTATGTEFDVRLDPAGLEVTLAQGQVRVEEPRAQFRRGQVAELKAGWRLVARDEGDRWRAAPVDLDKETAWISGRLNFFNDSLGEAAAEMNRYSDKKIVIRDPKLAAKPIVGVFRAGDIDGFAKAVRMYGLARVAVETDDFIELKAL